jgi:hypothetical protein
MTLLRLRNEAEGHANLINFNSKNAFSDGNRVLDELGLHFETANKLPVNQTRRVLPTKEEESRFSPRGLTQPTLAETLEENKILQNSKLYSTATDAQVVEAAKVLTNFRQMSTQKSTAIVPKKLEPIAKYQVPLLVLWHNVREFFPINKN